MRVTLSSGKIPNNGGTAICGTAADLTFHMKMDLTHSLITDVEALSVATGGPVNVNKLGKVMTYAYCLEGENWIWDFASNPVDIVFVS